MKSAPKSPDPYATAAAQTAANKEAIQESAKVSAVDQYSPAGSTTYQRDENGVPISQTVALSPENQRFYDTSSTVRNKLADTANAFTNFLPTSQFEMPDSMQSDKVADTLYQRKLGMIQPELDRADMQLQQQLADRGIPIGSEIYNDEMGRLARTRRDTLSALAQDATLAGGQEQDRQLQNALTLRALPFNELSAFLQGAPAMQTPQFQQTPTYSQQAPNIAGLISNDYANQLSAYNQQQSGLANGLFSLGAAAIGLSDRRLKTNIRRVGKLANGLAVYLFRYLGGDTIQIGVMAQDVAALRPEAVFLHPGGFLAVDYSKAVT